MVTFLLANMGSVIAANTSDTARSFNFGSTNFNLYTTSRPKKDASPVYFYVESLKGNDTLKARALTGNKKVSSYTPIEFINKPGEYCISSNIYEDGYRNALVHGSKYNLLTNLQAYGLWSPDSWSCPW